MLAGLHLQFSTLDISYGSITLLIFPLALVSIVVVGGFVSSPSIRNWPQGCESLTAKKDITGNWSLLKDHDAHDRKSKTVVFRGPVIRHMMLLKLPLSGLSDMHGFRQHKPLQAFWQSNIKSVVRTSESEGRGCLGGCNASSAQQRLMYRYCTAIRQRPLPLFAISSITVVMS